MSINTYYFNASLGGPTDAQAAWTSDASAFDGNVGTFASATVVGSESSNALYGAGTTSPTSGIEAIGQVRVRMFLSPQSAGGSITMVGKIYTAGLAETLGTITETSTVAKYTPYVVLTAPTGGWTYAKVNSLEVKFYISAVSAVTMRVSIAEVEVATGGYFTHFYKVQGFQ